METLSEYQRDAVFALGSFIGLYLIFLGVRWIGQKRLPSLFGHHHIRTLVERSFGRIFQLSLLTLALYIAVQRFEMSEKGTFVLNSICLSILVIQILIVLSIWIRYALSSEGPLNLGRGHMRVLQGTLTTVAVLAAWVIGILLLVDNLGFNVTTLLAGLGVGGLAVGLALQSVFGDMIASFIIGLDQPFEVGDFIIVDNMQGTVEHVGLKTTRIRSLGGEILVTPNGKLVNSNIQNFRKMLERRIVFTMNLSYDTAPEKLEKFSQLLREAVEEQQTARFDRAHFKAFGQWSLDYEVVYFVRQPDYTLYMDTQQRINLSILRRCLEHDISFAFPTTTLDLGRKEMAFLGQTLSERPSQP